MLSFACSIVLSLVHSLWQGALLYLVYAVAKRSILAKAPPVARRNLLLLLAAAQVALSCITFAVCRLHPGQLPAVQAWLQVPASPGWLQAAAPWLAVAYFTILAGRVAAMAVHWYRFRQLYKAGLHKAPAELKAFATLTAHHLGIKRKIQLYLSSTITAPVTFGFFKPVILLPVALVNRISMQQAEALVVHELTHISVHDYLFNWLLAAVSVLFFFNPFILRLCSLARLEREKHCDANVLYFGSNALQYAETLLTAAQMQRQQLQWQLAATGQKRQLLHRIRFFTSAEIHRPASKARIAVTAPLLLACLLGISATAVLLLPASKTSPAAATAAAAFSGTRNAESTYSLPPAPVVSAKEAAAPVQTTRSRKNLTAGVTPSKKAAAASIMPAAQPEGLIAAAYEAEMPQQNIVIEEQSTDGKPAALKIYTVSFRNGKWVVTPRWAAISQNILVDTGMLKKDTLLILPLQQQ